MPNKRQEQFLISEYVAYFERTNRVKASIAAGDEPPDFWLESSKGRYAVEVTRVLHEEDRQIASAQWAVVHDAEREAKRLGTLSGTYVVAFRNPLPFGKQRSLLKQCILDSVANTICAEPAAPTEIVIGGRSICEVQKHSTADARIIPIGGGIETLGGSKDDIRDQLRPLVAKAIRVKARKMARFQHPILVIYDLFWLASRSTFRSCVRTAPAASDFKEIYVVCDEGCGYPIAM
jgi:hypothetical protein